MSHLYCILVQTAPHRQKHGRWLTKIINETGTKDLSNSHQTLPFRNCIIFGHSSFELFFAVRYFRGNTVKYFLSSIFEPPSCTFRLRSLVYKRQPFLWAKRPLWLLTVTALSLPYTHSKGEISTIEFGVTGGKRKQLEGSEQGISVWLKMLACNSIWYIGV